jgi:hypothetical protein
MAKVMSEKQVSVPRMEFLGWASGLHISLQRDFEKEILEMIQADSSSFTTFGGKRVIEIKSDKTKD